MGFEAPDSGVHRSHIHVMTLLFAISLEKDQDVTLRKQGAPEDGRNRKGMKHGVVCPRTGEKLLTGGVEESPGRAEHRLTQGTKVKRQIRFLEEFPVQIRKLGVEMVRAVPGVRRLSLP